MLDIHPLAVQIFSHIRLFCLIYLLSAFVLWKFERGFQSSIPRTLVMFPRSHASAIAGCGQYLPKTFFCCKSMRKGGRMQEVVSLGPRAGGVASSLYQSAQHGTTHYCSSA